MQKYRLLEPAAFRIRENHRLPQVERRFIEHRIFVIGRIHVTVQILAGGIFIRQSSSHAAGGDFDHQPGSLPFDYSLARE